MSKEEFIFDAKMPRTGFVKSENKMRKVMFRYSSLEEYSNKGVFHQWFMREDSSRAILMAVIERENGKTVLIDADNVIFVNKNPLFE